MHTISFPLEHVSVTLRYCIVIRQLPGASWHLSTITKALSQRSGPRFAPSRTVWCGLMQATARGTDEQRGGSSPAVPSVRSTTGSCSSGQAVADELPIISSNKEQNDNAGRIQCPGTLCVCCNIWVLHTWQVLHKSYTSVSEAVLTLKMLV